MPNVGTVTVPSSTNGSVPVMPIKPRVHVPIIGFNPALEVERKQSPPDPLQPLINIALGPELATCGQDQSCPSRTPQ